MKGSSFLVASILMTVAACGSSSSPTSPSESAGPSTTTTTTTVPNPSPVTRYRVTFDATWSAATHPTDIPSNPHFSGLIGGTHNANVVFWQVGSLASEGIRNMAERGSKSPLDAEVSAATGEGRAQNLLSGGGISRSPDSVALEFDISLEYPLVTLVSMVAPSPDWFVGVSALSLLSNGDWVPEMVIELFPHDAGTDSGSTYNSPDRETVPREPIRRIDGPPFTVDGQVPPLGTFTFRRL